MFKPGDKVYLINPVDTVQEWDYYDGSSGKPIKLEAAQNKTVCTISSGILTGLSKPYYVVNIPDPSGNVAGWLVFEHELKSALKKPVIVVKRKHG